MRRVAPRGFTLVELFLVIALLGILALVGLPLLRGAAARADAAHVRSDVRHIETAAVQFREQRGALPESTPWAVPPADLAAWLGDGMPFTYKDLDYRLLRTSTLDGGQRLDVQVRYSSDSPVGEALQRFRGERVAWTRTRTTFQLLP